MIEINLESGGLRVADGKKTLWQGGKENDG
jgi:hypothetical protein